MVSSDSTRWSVIQGAAEGHLGARDTFARIYTPVVQAYLARRWGGTPLIRELDDAIQEVFVDCFRDGGVIERARSDHGGGFRAFLYGVVRVVALRVETRRAKQREHPFAGDDEAGNLAQNEATLSQVFDREWARALLAEATRVQEERAREAGEAAMKRVELLRLRFQEGMPIREIAQAWGAEAADLHREYAKARDEFRAALTDVVSLHYPRTPGEVERECALLVAFLK